MKYLAIVLTGLAAVTSMRTAKGAIEIDGSVSASVYDHDLAITTTDELNWLDYVAPTTLTASNSGASSTTTVGRTTTGAETIISLGMNHQRNGDNLRHARSNTILYFTANEDLAYSLTGFYDVEHVGGPNGANLFLEFRDTTTGDYLFYNHQTSYSTLDEQLILGEPGGDAGNDIHGDLTGMLIQGHGYLLNFQAYMDAFPHGSDLGASAEGNITLSLVNPAAVPEPAQLATWLGLGLCCAVGYRLRRRSAIA